MFIELPIFSDIIGIVTQVWGERLDGRLDCEHDTDVSLSAMLQKGIEHCEKQIPHWNMRENNRNEKQKLRLNDAAVV